MPNFQNTIDSHNHNIIANKPEDKTCNCRNKTECPLQGKCRSTNTIYKATVSTDNSSESYIGATENEFKTRLANHKQSFKKETLRNATELSKHIWNLKDKNINYEIKWAILDRANPYSTKSKRCNLCTTEKYHILFNKSASLNKRSEIINTCRHSTKFLLKQVT